MKFIESNNFKRELKFLTKKYKDNNIIGFENLKNLLEKQFDSEFPEEVIGPGKIHRIENYENGALWKVEMSVRGLRPSQWPRVWFYISCNIVYFLDVGAHQDNYDNKSKESKSRDVLKEFLFEQI